MNFKNEYYINKIMALESTTLKICEYFNDIGILDYDSVNSFLSLYSEIGNKNNFSNQNDILRNSIFSYMRIISENDTLLFEFSKRILNSFFNFQLISRYKSVKALKSILNIKLKNILIHFFFRLIRTKGKKSYRYLMKNYNPKNTNSNYDKITQIINTENLNYPNDNFINLFQNQNYNFHKKSNTENNETINSKTSRENFIDNLTTEKTINYPMKRENYKAKIIKTVFPKEKNLFELKKEQEQIKRKNKINYDSQIRKTNYNKIKQQYLNDENQNYYRYYSKNDLKNQRAKSQNTSIINSKIKIPNEENISENHKRYKINIPFKKIKANSNDKKNEKNLDNDDIKNGNEIIKSNVIDRLYKKEMLKMREKKMKENIEKEINKKKDIIDWDKINYENNVKYTENIYNEKSDNILNNNLNEDENEDKKNLNEKEIENNLNENDINNNNEEPQFLDIQSLSSVILSPNRNGSLKQIEEIDNYNQNISNQNSIKDIKQEKNINSINFDIDNFHSNSIKELLKDETKK